MPDLDGLPVSEQEIQLLRDLTNAGTKYRMIAAELGKTAATTA